MAFRERSKTDAKYKTKEHRDERAKWKVLVELGGANCCLCGYPIAPGGAFHLDHTPDGTGYRGAAHPRCNVVDGARRGRARQGNHKPRRDVL